MLRRPTIFAVLVLAGAGASGCGEDEPSTRPVDQAAAPAPSAQRYCALTRELDRAGEEVFGGLGEDAGPAEYEAAERRFVERYADKLDALRQAAPRPVAPDARVLLAAQRERAGLPTGARTEQADVDAAEKRLRAWEKRNCKG